MGIQSAGGQVAGKPTSSEAPLLYTDQERGYTLAIPPGAEAQKGEKHDIVVQSRKGYRITVQSARHNKNDTLWAMLARLEALYLGPEKTWTRKFGTQEISVGGLDALDSKYEGARTRVRCVLVQGAVNDTVFMFFAPPKRFDELVHEFDWILENFKPSDADHVASAPTRETSTAMVSAAPQWPRLSDPSLGYLIAYPPDWTVTRVSESSIIIGGPEKTPAYDVTVAIQNVEPRQSNTGSGVLSDVVEDLKIQFRNHSGAKLAGEGTYRYETAGLSLVGRQILSSYSVDGTSYQQWTVVIPMERKRRGWFTFGLSARPRIFSKPISRSETRSCGRFNSTKSNKIPEFRRRRGDIPAGLLEIENRERFLNGAACKKMNIRR